MSNTRDSLLLIGAGGRTGLCALRSLCAAAVPVIACVRRADRLPREPRLAAAEVAVVDLEQPGALAPLLERSVHVIYLAGASRRSLSAGAWQVEVESLALALEVAQRAALPGRWIYVGFDHGPAPGGLTWSESRWRELKREAEGLVASSALNYFILRTGRVTDLVRDEPRVAVSQSFGSAMEGELPCNALAFLLTGVALSGATHRAQASVRVDAGGIGLQQAVDAFSRLRRDRAATASAPWRQPAR
jgi:nucleoside-diphosphate-sugar epimerase